MPAPPTGDRRRAEHSTLTAAERTDSARRAANARWAAEPDRAAATAPARAQAGRRFYAGADAAGITDPVQREQMAAAAMAAHMAAVRLGKHRKARLAGQPGAAARAGDAA